MEVDDGNNRAIVEVSDIFGLGKVANSKAVERLILSVVDGVGSGIRSLFGPWAIRREASARIDSAALALEQLPHGASLSLDLADRASLRISRDAERRQLNREAIAELALINARTELEIGHLDAERSQNTTQTWLDDFWRRAEMVAEPDLRVLWSKVLLREARAPGELSLRSLSLLSQLSRREAQMIENLAPFVVNFERDNSQDLAAGTLLSIGQYQGTFAIPEETAKSFKEAVLELIPDFDLVALDAAGIMQSSNGWASEYSVSPRPNLHVVIGNALFAIEGLPEPNEKYRKRYTLGEGWGFTSEGYEIARIVNAPPNSEYVRCIGDALSAAGCNLISVVDG